ncbi:AfsR/SARP family transcriptional regulator [Sphaerisporangium corydalis]|uniref:BTAD domain-containing putative transcriptional regulator n=1 Tax=Sphaerisporangium corydalis TaxID=1441875 RepID=A0ABV9EA86_9ACTN|nr:BTAD domain-containing putative transcriptional regulator [Sphaerisporangium corydalis]
MSTRLRLNLVGTFTVSQDGRTWPATKVGSRKARRILALLAVERGRLVSLHRVVEALWDQAPPRRSAENVATLVSRLRTTLDPEVIAGGRTGYRLGPAVGVDVYQAGDLVTRAERMLSGHQPVSAASAARRAVDLLTTAEVLEDEPDALWAEPARRLQGDLLRRARHAAAEAALRTGDLTSAQAAGEAALRTDPLDEIACRLVMRAHTKAGDTARALAVYQRLREALAEELGVDPARATRDLHMEILLIP